VYWLDLYEVRAVWAALSIFLALWFGFDDSVRNKRNISGEEFEHG
jgi:hypothetical protein